MTPHAWRLFELAQLRGVGAKTLRVLASRQGLEKATQDELRSMDARLARALKDHRALDRAQHAAEQQRELAERYGARILAAADADYPMLLDRADDAPAFLYVKGEPGSLGDHAISVIGTREPSTHGLLITERLTQYFAGRGWTIVSGLALGCDAAAHRAALACGGRTVAVLAHGLQTVAPRQHADLAEEIVANRGALVTEYPYGTDAAPHQFVQRDRIQAGLTRGVVMVQSDLEGGSLHASRAALRYGRRLAVPRPTAADLNAQHPKIKANLVLAEGTAEEKSQLLQCDAAALGRVRVFESREDYGVWEAELMAVSPTG